MTEILLKMMKKSQIIHLLISLFLFCFRCLDNDVDENSLNMAAAAEGNNLDRETESAGNQASSKSNIEVTDDKRWVSLGGSIKAQPKRRFRSSNLP